MVRVTRTAGLDRGRSRVQLALIISLGLAIAALYWTDHEFTLLCTEGGVPFIVSTGLTRDDAFSLIYLVEDCAAIVVLAAYFAVLGALILRYRACAIPHILPLSMIGVVFLVLILFHRQQPYWLADAVIWGLPMAVGVTFLQELLMYRHVRVAQA